ncbi:MAG TPA: rhodanese-like domain-containing protein [Luteolibacter sp.]|nr:rhodanese-like domain-containing protein [Luteolibacter sp.]
MNITARELNEQLQSAERPVLIDVRTPAEFAEVHIAGAHSLPLGRLSADQALALLGQAPRGVFVCLSGKRSGQACEKLQQIAAGRFATLEGGLETWQRLGLPVEKGATGRLPIMRQVQLIAGSLVLTGSLLALFVDIRWAWLPAMVGTGLTLAGTTGFCGMALLLARMPWNKVRS